MSASRKSRIHRPAIVIVATLCLIVLTVFFVSRSRQSDPLPAVVCDSLPDDSLDDFVYYQMEADEFARMLPADKVVLTRRIDDSAHCVYYTEKSTAPSCYVYDLDTRKTRVLFGGSKSFDCEGRMLKLKTLKAWCSVENRLYFVFASDAPDAGYDNAVVVFGVDIQTDRLYFIDYGTDARFDGNDRVVVVKAERSSVPSDFHYYFDEEEESYVTHEVEYSLHP